MEPECRELRFIATEKAGEVSAIMCRPPHARVLFLCAHGAGAGMRHPFLEDLARRLATFAVATFRYQFPYLEAGRRRPDHARVLEGTVRAAAAAAARYAGDLPMVAGGKSMGGRMTARVQATSPLPELRGLVFLGFPLHPAGRPDTARAAHLFELEVPMLFLQGDRDTLADLDLLRPICGQIGSQATLHVVEGGDHSFEVLKRSGRTAEEVRQELAEVIASWATPLG